MRRQTLNVFLLFFECVPCEKIIFSKYCFAHGTKIKKFIFISKLLFLLKGVSASNV